MIPSLAELRKNLVRDPASESALNRDLWSPTKAASSFRPSSPEFPIVCQSLPKIAPYSGLVCRLCRRSEPGIVLVPKYVRPRPSQIIRSSLEGWLKHDFVFFGKSYLCEVCAKARSLI